MSRFERYSETWEPTPDDPLQTMVLSEATTAELNVAIKANSKTQLQKALDNACDADLLTMDIASEFLNYLLKEVVAYGSGELAKSLVEEGAEVVTIDIFDLSKKPSIELFEGLHAAGYDFNQASPKNDNMRKGRNMLYMVLTREELLKWLLDNGTSVDIGEEEFFYRARPPPILESCVALGTVGSFKLLKEHGAKMARRCLHKAAGEAAAVGANPFDLDGGTEESNTEDEFGRNRERELRDEWAEMGLDLDVTRKRAGEMLRYLVEEMHLNVNALDWEEGYRFEFWGPPLNYAARHERGAAVVRYLLSKGADPSIASADGTYRAEKLAKKAYAYDIFELLYKGSRPIWM